MSINIVKEKSPRTPKKLRIIDAEVEYPVVEPVVKEKKVRKGKEKPVLEPMVKSEPEPVVVSEEVFIPAPPVVEPPVVEVQAPVVVDTVFQQSYALSYSSTAGISIVAETPPESELELFKKLSKKINKEKRDAKLKALTPEELEAKREIARQKNKDYRANNKDKIKAKDKKYATEKAPIIKEKRVTKLKDPVAKAAYNEQQRLYKAKMRAEAKASVEPKPPKEAKMTKAQQLNLIMSSDELTAEEKLERVAKLIK